MIETKEMQKKYLKSKLQLGQSFVNKFLKLFCVFYICHIGHRFIFVFPICLGDWGCIVSFPGFRFSTIGIHGYVFFSTQSTHTHRCQFQKLLSPPLQSFTLFNPIRPWSFSKAWCPPSLIPKIWNYSQKKNIFPSPFPGVTCSYVRV